MGGLFVFGGGPVDGGLLADLGSSLERLGPDGGREVMAGSVGMTFRAFHTNAESRLERQPLAGRSCLITWDGRLDNREELIALVGDELRGDHTDVAIVQATYIRWGAAAFGRIIGDFALALWDSSERALFLARDCIGTRALYYHVNRDRILWSTDLGPLLDLSGVPIEVNDEYIAGFLTRGPDVGLTPYVNVHAIKPAFFLRVDVDGLVSERRFWELRANKEIRYATDGEYEEGFRHVFREAVRVRLRSDGPVFADLSGGLDSSSIVCMGDDILKAREAKASAIVTMSYVCDRSQTSNESRFIEIVERYRGARGHHILETQAPLKVGAGINRFAPFPGSVFLASGLDAAGRALMKEAEARVRLSGIGGDEMLNATNNPSPELADLLWSGRLRTLHDRILVWSRTLKEPYTGVLFRRSVAPLLPYAWGRKLARRTKDDIESLLNPRFATLVRIAETRAHPSCTVGRQCPSQRDHARALQSAVCFLADGHRQDEAHRELTYPFLHRPLVEFLHGVPFGQKVRPGESRSLQRRALKALLPPETVQRRGKGRPAEFTSRSLVDESESLRDLILAPEPSIDRYFDRRSLLSALAGARAGVDPRRVHVVRIVAVIAWLQSPVRRTQLPAMSPSGGLPAAPAAAT